MSSHLFHWMGVFYIKALNTYLWLVSFVPISVFFVVFYHWNAWNKNCYSIYNFLSTYKFIILCRLINLSFYAGVKVWDKILLFYSCIHWTPLNFLYIIIQDFLFDCLTEKFLTSIFFICYFPEISINVVWISFAFERRWGIR